MQIINFDKTRRSTELLVDSRRIKEIDRRSPSLREPHTTTFYELFFFTQVNGALTADGNKLELNGPTAVLFPPLVNRQWDITYDPESFLVFFESEFIETFLNDNAFLHRLHFFSCSLRVPVLPMSEEQKKQILPGILALREELENSKVDSIYLLRSYLYQLLLQFNRFYNDYHQLDANLYRNSEIIQFKNLLKKHIHNKQTVQAYAEMMKMPRNRMNELSVKVFGKQAHQLIREELIQAIKTDLLNTNLSVAEISYKYEFSAPSNFTRYFKSHEGMTPAAYREKYGV
ncbi:helix-turn-helix domain-containing protein [Mangrovibacterium diazotrophicum]|uniref:AraC-like DNA-binding protein n=1 Tax=Mangrovibacterium diazotrophicum TaxID=1261403 RepID=A0A419VWS7_9BACT|nr:AraC family transcriptional regulator [Mangrovibacterium diazotrophicum]RKD87695.1 AraC-like DNA-binding protein [Mangrovibacterium diazotrophicum]